MQVTRNMWILKYPSQAQANKSQWNTIQPAQTLHPHIYRAYSSGYASFVQTGDPNTHRLTKTEYPEIETGKLFLIGDGGAANSTTPLRTEKFDELRRRCDFWKENAADVPLWDVDKDQVYVHNIPIESYACRLWVLTSYRIPYNITELRCVGGWVTEYHIR